MIPLVWILGSVVQVVMGVGVVAPDGAAFVLMTPQKSIAPLPPSPQHPLFLPPPVSTWGRYFFYSENVTFLGSGEEGGGDVGGGLDFLELEWMDGGGGMGTVLTLYDVWHTPAYWAARSVESQGGQVLTVEDVIRSNGTMLMRDIWEVWDVEEAADDFYYQTMPTMGKYCLYEERVNSSYLPTCPNITQTLTKHLEEFAAIGGVDVLVVDGTNLDTHSEQADVIQMNPTITLWEKFAEMDKALRSGKKRVGEGSVGGGASVGYSSHSAPVSSNLTIPRLAAWQRCAPNSTYYLKQLALYNRYPSLAFTNPRSGKKVFFTPLNPDPTIVKEIESNGGRNDVEVVVMWALRPQSDYENGMWSFFGRCSDSTGANAPRTTSVVGRGLSPCNQPISQNSPLGSQIAVSPSYQDAYSSLPYQAAGKFNGNTLKRQFATLFASPTVVDNIVLSTFNELLAQPQRATTRPAYEFSWGLPNDPERSELFVDTYGSSIGRDWEPSHTHNDTDSKILASCFRVLTLLQHNLTTPTSPATPCPVPSELCCQFLEEQEAYHNVWALRTKEDTDRLVTADANERKVLLQQGWVEQCSPYPGPTDWCVDSSLPSSPEALRGPFIVANNASTTSTTNLFRCYNPPHHFFSTDPNCEGLGSHENLLGNISPTRSSNTPRHLIRCQREDDKVYYHVLDGTCDPGDNSTPILGFVH